MINVRFEYHPDLKDRYISVSLLAQLSTLPPDGTAMSFNGVPVMLFYVDGSPYTEIGWPGPETWHVTLRAAQHIPVDEIFADPEWQTEWKEAGWSVYEDEKGKGESPRIRTPWMASSSSVNCAMQVSSLTTARVCQATQ